MFSPYLRLSLPLVTALLLAGACDPALDLPEEAVKFRCDPPDCGLNSPHINSLMIGDVKLSNASSSELRLVGVLDHNEVLHDATTNVTEDLAAVTNGVITHSGAQLVGWKLLFAQDGVQFKALIQEYELIPSAIVGNRPMSVYALSYEAESLHANVCPLWHTSPFEPVVTFIRGETYDREEKHVENIGSEWLTIACANEAAYKTKWLGYGPTSYDPNNLTPVDWHKRNATLKMVTADYCGDGVSYTATDTAVAWSDAAGTIVQAGVASEAVWTEDGALCLDATRIPAMMALVEEACDIPTCAEIGPKAQSEEVVWRTQISN